MNKDSFCCSEWTCTKKHILTIIGHHEEKWQTWMFNVVWNSKPCDEYITIWTNIVLNVSCRNFDHNNFSGTMNMLTWDK